MTKAWLWTSCALVACTASPDPAVAEPRKPAPAAAEEKASDPEPARVLHTEWHDNGLKALEGWLVAGRRHGTWQAWHDNGLQAWEGRYDHGVVDGLWIFRDKIGIPG